MIDLIKGGDFLPQGGLLAAKDSKVLVQGAMEEHEGGAFCLVYVCSRNKCFANAADITNGLLHMGRVCLSSAIWECGERGVTLLAALWDGWGAMMVMISVPV